MMRRDATQTNNAFTRFTYAAGSSGSPPSASSAWSNRIWARSWKCTLPSSFFTSTCSWFTSGFAVGCLLAGLLEPAVPPYKAFNACSAAANWRISSSNAGGSLMNMGRMVR
jgi:hypothetical protein